MGDRVKVAPERGDVVAAGTVVLTTFALVLDLRFGHAWAAGVRLLVIGLLAALIGSLAVSTPLEEAVPRPYQAVLNVSTFVLATLALGNLADALGADSQFGSAGSLVWIGLVLVALGAWFATRRRSPIMTLLAAGAAVVVVNEFFEWVGSVGNQTHRWLLLLSAIALALGAVALRDLRRRDAVSLVDAAGLSIVALGLSLAIARVFVFQNEPAGSGPTGWELVLLVAGFGLVAYGAIDRERVPAFIGVACLGLFVIVAGPPSRGGASLVGWPIVLLALAAALLVVGLRPRRPLPPEPPVPPAPAPPTAPTAVAGAHAAEGGGSA